MAVDSGDIAGMVITVVITIAIAGTIVLRGLLGRALARVAEREERLDFAERMLARSDSVARLPGGGEAS